MQVAESSWVIISTLEKGPVKCVHMARDALRTLSLGRCGTFPVSALANAKFNVPLLWENGVLSECALPAVPQDKNGRKNAIKRSRTITVTQPTLPGLVEMYNLKGTVHISHEAISQILFHAIGAKRVIVKDDHNSIVLAAVAAARGTHNLFRIGGHVQNIHTLCALGESGSVEKYVASPSPLEENASLKGASEKEGGALFVLAQRDRYEPCEVISLLKECSFQTADFLVYHPVKEALLDLFNALMQDKAFGLLDLRELFYREYQTVSGAMHPRMTKTRHSGYILTGTLLGN
ncbi:uncharacterized protein NEMAJ01_1598 [Nematocida major]|uniref:uncharacterized protein n=1 Tax=Nematocida major TaxID=1912982 RepID=UPI0020075C61|nr:uncharacterized protein NEMAJ01_1598 [Nematocida major]KAH9386702.1 hypothetical protein NEMAJ01_1598 [Nematocida major]